MDIKTNLTTRNYTAMSNKQNKYIVIHYVGAVSSAQANANYFKSTYRGASAHYFVDENDIYQVVSDSNASWHCGASYYKHLSCRNSNSIGIEMCCYSNNGKLDVSDKVVERTIELTKELMAKYDIPVQNVIRHYDVTGKNCPAPFVEDSSRWTAFLNGLQSSSTDYNQGDYVEISCPFYFTGAVEGDRYLYDNKTEMCWVHSDTKSLIENDNLVARALMVYSDSEKCIVQVFDDQFWIDKGCIAKKL